MFYLWLNTTNVSNDVNFTLEVCLPIRYTHSWKLVNGPKFRPKGAGMTSYNAVFEHSIKNPEEFWAEAAKNITWYKPFDDQEAMLS